MRVRLGWWLLASALCLAGLGSRTARAHAGQPISTDIIFNQQPGGAPHESIQTTYGLLQPDATGAWRLMCEETLELGLKTYQLWPDGEIGMGDADGYAFSNDGCNFKQATGVTSQPLSFRTSDFTASGGPELLVLLASLNENQDLGTNLYVSSDRGRSFSQVLVPSGVNILSLAVLNTSPPQVVLTAEDPVATSDGGTTLPHRWLLASSACLLTPRCSASDWARIQLDSAVFGEGAVQLLAAETEGLFVRHVGADGTSQVYRSTDGGMTFTQVLPASGLTLTNPVTFIDRVGPNDFWAAAGVGQTLHSTDGGATWQLRTDLGDIRCVHSDGQALHACVVSLAKDQVSAVSTDNGVTWTPELFYNQVKGIKQCPPNSDVGNACDDLWLVIQLSFQGQQAAQPSPPPPPKHGCDSIPPSGLGLLALALVRRRDRRSR